MDSVNWDDLRFFTALVECCTVSAASKRLNVNYVTVSRRIERLEHTLRQRLFDRTQEGYVPTVEGLILYKKTSLVRENVESLEEYFSLGGKFKKSVVISMVSSMAEYCLIPKLSDFVKKYPEIRLEIDVSNRNVSIPRKEADIALRLELPEKGEYLSKKVGEITYKLCAIPEMIEKIKKEENVSIITFNSDFSHLPESQYLIRRFGNKSIRFQSNSVTIQRIAAENGYGVALLPSLAIKNSPLVSIELDEPIIRSIWMLTSKYTMQMTASRLVADELKRIFDGMK
ncbi:putative TRANSCRIPTIONAL REGULATOR TRANSCRIPTION REGULATOR PROTEIN [Xenorhabdus poinarii G6]|uniref:Putative TRANSCRIPTIONAL REGULATOR TRANSCRIPTION REGULATOR PROTEIN n=1 Tax=Xenorhabdus poinarii G6 TaxID=1354304 RepID=A0A068R300_9GAMM|nr:LysR family transcriptional regulator [Xenorhabdus poinarii]CDG21568.1 putative TRANSCRIPTIONAL REGULATOR TRANSCRIPTION REGULATOR PROTEIN [Xenorhabdus poinarii G6]